MIAPEMPSRTRVTTTQIIVIVPVQKAFSLFTRRSNNRPIHGLRLRTTNPIESTFDTVRNRSKITKGPGSRAAGIAMAYKLIEAAQSRWRAVNAPHLVALVRAGAKFENGQLVERPDDETTAEQAA